MNPAQAQAIVGGFALILPELVLGVGACVLFLGGTFRPGSRLWGWAALAVVALGAVSLAATPLSPAADADAAAAALFNDRLALLTKLLALAGCAVLVLVSWGEVGDQQAADYYGCLLLVTAGVGATASANELVTLFVALELVSIPTYVLLYLPRFDGAAQEAAMKYFLLSVFSSALVLLGFALLYGLGGTTNLPAITDALSALGPTRLPALAVAALALTVAGLGFRITAAPFHYYAPDVYQGAPTPAAAVLAYVPKVAGFVALVRVLGLVVAGRAGAGTELGDQATRLLWLLAVATMTLGNVLAIWQTNLKRLLAYSSVAHAGYMLIGLAVASAPESEDAGDQAGAVAAVFFYLAAYGAMTIGAFGVLSYLSTPGRPLETEDQIAGLARRQPGVALLMLVFLLSLIGIPLTAGFAGKLVLFWGALGDGGPFAEVLRWLAVAGAVNAAVGAYYYLRIVAKMYLFPSVEAHAAAGPAPTLAALFVCALLTVALGVYPEPLLRRARAAAGLIEPAPPVAAAPAGLGRGDQARRF